MAPRNTSMRSGQPRRCVHLFSLDQHFAHAPDIQTIWADQRGGYASPGFALFVNTYHTADQKIDFASGDGVKGNETTTASGTVSLDQWHLLAAEVNRTNGSVNFVVDGVSQPLVSPGSSVITDFINQAELELGSPREHLYPDSFQCRGVEVHTRGRQGVLLRTQLLVGDVSHL